MSLRRAVAALALLVALAPAGALGAPRTIADPPPDVAKGVVQDLVDALSQGVADVRLGPRATTRRVSRASLAEAEAVAIARESEKLQDWIETRPLSDVRASYSASRSRWTISFIRRDRAENRDVTEAEVFVDDDLAEITEVRTGPQVGWMMARGYDGAFGRGLNRPVVWGILLALFLLPLVAWRRLVSWRTLDLLAMASFTVSLVWFNRGQIFTSVPLAYPPLAYLCARCLWIGLRRDRPTTDPDAPRRSTRLVPRAVGGAPTWVLATLLAMALGLRYGMNAFDSNVIDVGYAGVIGADRIAHGQTPYGTFPSDCGRCDTYGPLVYLLGVPFEALMPWEGRWDELPAAHAAAVLFDLLAVAAMVVLGWQLGGRRLAVLLGLGWAAFPFTAYSLESNANDSLVAAALAWGLVLARRPVGRGLMLGLAVASKFAPALLLLLWARHPFPRGRPRRGAVRYVGGLALAAGLTGWVLLLDGDDGIRAFWSRTLGYQLDRDSPFSIWGQHESWRPAQLALTGAVCLGALLVPRWPRRLDLRRFAALSGAILIGSQLVITHWFYLYIPWFVPFLLLVIVPEWVSVEREEPGEPAPAPVVEAVAA